MRFKVLKSSLDGISGGTSEFNSIDEVLREVSYHRGWDTKAELHAAIRRWAAHAEPGSVFTTSVTAIVSVGVGRGVHADDCCTECGHDGLEYDDISPVESGDIEQKVSCPACGGRWNDVFVLAERRPLSRRQRKGRDGHDGTEGGGPCD